MMTVVNKWATIYMFIGMTVLGHTPGYLKFMVYHPRFTIYIIGMSILSGIGQFFVYRMIKQFKQHFVPFTITSRKILTVVASIILVGHKTNVLQILGVIIVLATVVI